MERVRFLDNFDMRKTLTFFFYIALCNVMWKLFNLETLVYYCYFCNRFIHLPILFDEHCILLLFDTLKGLADCFNPALRMGSEFKMFTGVKMVNLGLFYFLLSLLSCSFHNNHIIIFS